MSLGQEGGREKPFLVMEEETAVMLKAVETGLMSRNYTDAEREAFHRFYKLMSLQLFQEKQKFVEECYKTRMYNRLDGMTVGEKESNKRTGKRTGNSASKARKHGKTLGTAAFDCAAAFGLGFLLAALLF